MLTSTKPAMEYQANIIFILFFSLSIVEPIPSPEKSGRYGAHQATHGPKPPNQPRQYQNYQRPQSIHVAVNGASNRNYNQDYRPYERNYENRYSTVSQGPGEKRPSYEGTDGKNNRPYYQHESTPTSGLHYKDKPAVPLLRPTRLYEYHDRNNGRYSPQVERNYQQPVNKPYYASRIPYHRSMSENVINRNRDYSQPQRPSYFDKQIGSENRPSSPVDFRYTPQRRGLDSLSETFKSSQNMADFTTPDGSTTLHPTGREMTENLTNKIQNYLASNHKKYLILHSNGTVENVDSLDTIVQNYPNYVMVKAGDIIANTNNSSIETVPPKPPEEILPIRIPEDMHGLSEKTENVYGYNNPRVPYVTEKVYAQTAGSTLQISNEVDSKFDNAELVIMTTPAVIDLLTDMVETTTEYDTPTHYTVNNIQYGSLRPLLRTSKEYDNSDILDYDPPTTFVDTTTEYLTYAYSTTELTTSSTPISVKNEFEIFTVTPIEILAQDYTTNAQFIVTAEESSNLVSTTIYSNEEMTTENIALQEKTKAPMQRGFYHSALGKLIRKHFGTILAGSKFITAKDGQNETRLGESVTDPFNATDILDAFTELTVTNLSTTERMDAFYDMDELNTSSPVTIDLIDKTSTLHLFDEKQTIYSETPSIGDNEKLLNPYSLNPFIIRNNNNEQTTDFQHDDMHSEILGSALINENRYNTVATESNENPFVLNSTIGYNNPFVSYDDLYTESASGDENTYLADTELYDSSNPFVANNKKNTNPFIDSAITQIITPRRRIRNKKRLKLFTDNNNEVTTNPFLPILNTAKINESTERQPEYFTDYSDEKENETILYPLKESNLLDEDLQNPFVTNEGDDSNPFAENNADFITLSQIEIPQRNDSRLVFEESENIYETNIIPFAYLPNENAAYELTTAPIPHYDVNTATGDFDIFPTTPGELTVLTTTEKPTVWFKTDLAFWEKLSNGTVPYDVVYFFQVQAQPLVEKDVKNTIFPNGTIVQELIETVWERDGDPAPIMVKTTKAVYPDEES